MALSVSELKLGTFLVDWWYSANTVALDVVPLMVGIIRSPPVEVVIRICFEHTSVRLECNLNIVGKVFWNDYASINLMIPARFSNRERLSGVMPVVPNIR